MDAKAIETLSVNAVRNSIVTSPYLDQYISDNDKEPSWDGNIYIYNNKRKNKTDLVGRIPVQVKGCQGGDFSKEVITFPIQTADLRNYLNDGGVVFFVVYISFDGYHKKIYYNDLSPLKIKSILESSKEQKTRSVDLREFPSDGLKKRTS